MDEPPSDADMIREAARLHAGYRLRQLGKEEAARQAERGEADEGPDVRAAALLLTDQGGELADIQIADHPPLSALRAAKARRDQAESEA